MAFMSKGPEALRALPQKRKKPKSKKKPSDTKRNIQLAGTGLPSTLDEGTRKSQPLPEGTKSNPKDSVGNKQSIDMGFPSTISDEGAAKTMPFPEGPRRDKDLEGLKPPLIWNHKPILLLIFQGLVLSTRWMQPNLLD
ncbi:hypothetical protein Tco_1519209 [Tanacetum coccineum]